MTRSLFDPHKALGAPEAPPTGGMIVPPPSAATPVAAASAALRVTQVVELIKATLELRTPSPLRVVGQVSNLKPGNHWYFSLKDEQSVLHCVAWNTAVRKFGFVPRDGDEVVAAGHLSHYGPQGKTQLYVDTLQPVGAGALDVKFRAMCDQLRGLGYFDESRKRVVPMFPRRIAVITSRTGAALTDVIATAAQRCRAVKLLVIDVRVQGEGAADDIARAIAWVDRHHVRLGVDAMLVTRGGGSIEDLWAFNERIVADAVYRRTVPVVAAVGHESDTTIIELVADVRASTPTQAIMRLIPSSADLCRHIHHLSDRLGFALARYVQQQKHRAARVAADLSRIMHARLSGERAKAGLVVARLNSLKPTTQLAQRQSRVAVMVDRLHRAIALRTNQRLPVMQLQARCTQAVTRHINRLRQELRARQQQLEAMNPEGVLQRGYSITFAAGGAVVRSVLDVRRGDGVLTRVSDGEFRAVVSGSVREAPHAAGARGEVNVATHADDADIGDDDGREQLDLFDSGR